MRKKFLFISILTIIAIGVLSCKDDIVDNNDCSGAWANELSAEITAMSNAAQAYGTNPTTENCLAYKSAAQAYVNGLEPYGNCATLTGQNRIAWQNAIDEAKQDVEDFACDE